MKEISALLPEYAPGTARSFRLNCERGVPDNDVKVSFPVATAVVVSNRILLK
jgi:hypothetical protein